MQEVDSLISQIRKWVGHEAECGFISTFICGCLINLCVYVNHFPTVAALNCFLYTSHCFEIGVPFTCLGVWVVLKNQER